MWKHRRLIGWAVGIAVTLNLVAAVGYRLFYVLAALAALSVVLGVLWLAAPHLWRNRLRPRVRKWWRDLWEGRESPAARRRLLAKRWAEQTIVLDSRVTAIASDSSGDTLTVALKPGDTTATVLATVGKLESALKTRTGWITVKPDLHRRAHICRVRVAFRPQPAPEWPGASLSTITEPIGLGVDEEGQPVSLTLWQQNLLIAGQTRAGKSGVVNLLLAELTNTGNVAVLGVDLKAIELAPWRSCLSALATTNAEAAVLLGQVVKLIENRKAYLARRGSRKWVPTSDAPAVVLVVDEFAQLGKAETRQAAQIAATGLALGVTLICSTQKPSADALGEGGTSLRSQLGAIIGLRCRDSADAEVIFGRGKTSDGWRPDRLTEPGSFLLDSPHPDHAIPRPARAFWLPDAVVAATVKTHAANRPHLELPGEKVSPIGDTESTETAAEMGPMGPTDTPILAALADGELSRGQLMERTGRSKSSLDRDLQPLLDAGKIRKVRHGYYAAQSPNVPRSPAGQSYARARETAS